MKVSKNLRDDNWLLARLDRLWSTYFDDIAQENPLVIRFGRYSRYRLGSIKQNYRTKFSSITITGMFKDENIPVEVVDHTIAHELIHYIHGFSSSRRRLHKYPHAGGVVKQEMEGRQMGHLHVAYRNWVKVYRQNLMKI